MTGAAPATGGISGGRSLRPLGGVLAAMAVSLTGTRISAVALPWFVLVTTGSATRTGLVAFCEMAPYVLVKALGRVVKVLSAGRRPARTLAALSESSSYAQYEDDPPPCDRTHRTPPGPASGRTTAL